MMIRIYFISLALLLSFNSASACGGPIGVRSYESGLIIDVLSSGGNVPADACVFARTDCNPVFLVYDSDTFKLIFFKPEVFCTPQDRLKLRNVFLFQNCLYTLVILLFLLGVFIIVRPMLKKHTKQL